MKHPKIELELISLDRLPKLEDRVYKSISEYKTVLKSLKKAFVSSNLELVENLLLLEEERLNILTQRVKILRSHFTDLEKNGQFPKSIELELNNSLKELNSYVKKIQKELSLDKVELFKEISNVKERLRLFGKRREITSQRIDITI